MTNTTSTPAADARIARDVETVRGYCTRTAAQTARLADALVRLNVGGMSVRAIADAIADTDAPLGRNRLALIIRTRKAHADASPDAFRAALAAATAANTGTRTAGADAASTPADAAATVAAAVAEPDAPVHTLDTLTDRLADLFADARATLTGDALAAFLASVDAERADAVPVALPIAA